MINTLKNIAFVVEEGAEDGHSDLGDHAARLAQTHDAHLIGIYAIDTASGHRASGHARGAQALQKAAARRQLEQERIGKRVMVAWNGSSEARRSITDAMPFIVPAEEVRVVVVVVVDGDEHPRWKGADAGATLAHHLAGTAPASRWSRPSRTARRWPKLCWNTPAPRRPTCW